MKRISYILPIVIFIVSFIFIYIVTYSVTLNDTIVQEQKSSPYWLILAFILPPIVGLLFPKLKRLGIGSSNFLPNLIKYFKNRKVN